MRYNLFLERPDRYKLGGKILHLLGQAHSREEAENWARKRLRSVDAKYGDRAVLIPARGKGKQLIIG